MAVIGVGVMRGWVDGRWVVGWWVGGLVGGYVGGGVREWVGGWRSVLNRGGGLRAYRRSPMVCNVRTYV